MKGGARFRWLKYTLASAGLILLSAGILVGWTMHSFRSGLKPLADGAEFANGARTIKDDFVGVYLLPLDDGDVALIDCGADTKGVAILAELSRRGLGPQSVKAIFLTHAHPDHLAACHLFPRADIFAFVADAGIAEGTARAHAPMPWLIGTPADHRAKVTQLLADGKAVTIGGVKIVPYLVPGHTAGSAAFLVSGMLFVGDSLSIQADGAPRLSPWILSDSTAVNRASLGTLAKRLQTEHADVQWIIPAHSGAGKGAQALLAFAGPSSHAD